MLGQKVACTAVSPLLYMLPDAQGQRYPPLRHRHPWSLGYGVVPKELLTFLDSLYKEGAKTTSGTLVYRFERRTARKKSISSFQKHRVLNLECRILSQEHDTIGKKQKNKTNSMVSLAVTKNNRKLFYDFWSSELRKS